MGRTFDGPGEILLLRNDGNECIWSLEFAQVRGCGMFSCLNHWAQSMLFQAASDRLVGGFWGVEIDAPGDHNEASDPR
jgi:hypothetical protein